MTLPRSTARSPVRACRFFEPRSGLLALPAEKESVTDTPEGHTAPRGSRSLELQSSPGVLQSRAHIPVGKDCPHHRETGFDRAQTIGERAILNPTLFDDRSGARRLITPSAHREHPRLHEEQSCAAVEHLIGNSVQPGQDGGVPRSVRIVNPRGFDHSPASTNAWAASAWSIASSVVPCRRCHSCARLWSVADDAGSRRSSSIRSISPKKW